ncbi:MAG: N-acyl-D-amino-acid deacylase family protein [Rhodanobacter sp.]
MTIARMIPHRPHLALLCLAALLCGTSATAAPSKDNYDLVIENARVVDGTGKPAFMAEVVVKGDTIVMVSSKHLTLRARRVVDAHGRVLTPGFVDSHAHGDPLHLPMTNFISQGVTLIALGQDGRTAGSGDDNDDDNAKERMSLDRWRAAVMKKGVELNIAPFSGFGTLRERAGIGSAREVTPTQQARMRELLQQDLDAGAFGMTSGLEYVPDRYSSTAELVDLAKVVGRNGGVVESHMRSEDDDKIEGAIDELIAQGRYARVHISHIKVVLGHGAARGEEILQKIADANAQGVHLSADVYPYTAGSAEFELDYPVWAQQRSEFEAAVKHRRAELEAAIHARVLKRNGPSAILIETGSDAGLTVEQAAAKAGKPFETYMVDAGYPGPGAAHFVMDEALQEVFIKSPLVAFSTDGAPDIGHPRSWGSYSRIIEEFVEKRHALTLEAAVRKATSYPAQTILGLKNRGEIAPGMKADLVLFDPTHVKTEATWAKFDQPAEGFDLVVVNGQVAWENGAVTGVKAGRVLRRQRKR